MADEMNFSQSRIGVLFMQSQDYFGADSMIHRLLMKNLDRSRFDVHAACSPGTNGTASPSLCALSQLSGVRIRPTNFGPTVHARGKWEVLREAARRGTPAVADLLRLAMYARKQRIAVVHGTEKPRDAFYGLLLARAIRAKCVIHLHVGAEKWISPLSRWAMGRADALIGVSDFVSQTMVDLGYDSAKVHTVLNVLDYGSWDATPPTHESVRDEFGIRSETPLVVTASRLFPWKGQSDLLRALSLLHRSGRRFHLLVVGEDDPRATPGGGSYLKELQQLTTDLGLDDHVTFTGYRTDVARLMRACDIFAMPSFNEPFGVVYLEAMSAAKPVIGLDNGGTREVVVNGQTGLLSPSGDISSLATNLCRLLDNPELRKSLGLAGLERLKAYFSPERAAADVAEIYEAIR